MAATTKLLGLPFPNRTHIVSLTALRIPTMASTIRPSLSSLSLSRLSEVEASKDELLQTLEQRVIWSGTRLVKYEGFWFRVGLFKAILSSQKHFNPKDTDIILSTMPKSGTTWLKALTFCIINRDAYTIGENHPLLTSNPHELVPFLEYNIYSEQENPDLEHIPDPRIFSTHVPFNVLPDSTRGSTCRVIYICRNPLDLFISHWHFILEMKIGKDAKPIANMDEALDMFCEGISPFGPFWAHMLGYWNAHLENPEKVLFLKYEDLKEDIVVNVTKIAEFVGLPFSLEEQEQGMMEQISRLCSFENLSTLEVNKSGDVHGIAKKSSFFRKGQVGDWKNHLTPVMADRIIKLMESKFEGSDLMFNIYPRLDKLEPIVFFSISYIEVKAHTMF